MKMTRKIRFLALIAALSALAASCAMAPVPAAVMPGPATEANGVYTGSYDGGLVKATVSVALAAGRITSIKIVKHDCSPIGKKGEAIVDRVVERQTLQVDVVSGATGSSKVLLKAIEIALSGNVGS
ncbi:FMN-binding protein [bacterium]|nr:FMN-binding protein [bacterium]